MPPAPANPSPTAPRWLRVAAGWTWRLLVLGAGLLAALWLIRLLWVAILPVVVAVLITRILASGDGVLRRRGWRPGLAAMTTLGAFVVVLGGVIGLIGWRVVDEIDALGPTIDSAIDDIEDWLVDDSPFDIDRADVQNWRADAEDALDDVLADSSGRLIDGATLAAELLVAVFVGVIIAFFALKDGDRFLRACLDLVPDHRHHVVRRVADRAWGVLGGYLRGAATLGFVEGTIIGLTMTIVGASLALPMAIATFLAAFVPFVGAVAAGLAATLVTLATAGTGPALVVGIVALLVQQFDNELLAPVVYGRALELHPVAVLLAIIGGSALFGIVGGIFAVPVTALVVSMSMETHRALQDDAEDSPNQSAQGTAHA